MSISPASSLRWSHAPPSARNSHRLQRLGTLAVVGSSFVACSAPETPSTFHLLAPEPAHESDTARGRLGPVYDDDGKPAGFDSCVAETAGVDETPVHLVFMFDKSESMAYGDSPKWDAAKSAIRAFFESGTSKGVRASLTFFPDERGYSCELVAYSTPRVPMRELPSMTFGSVLDAQTPRGDTPTLMALKGALTYANEVKASAGKNAKIAIVLVTDGLPDSACEGNSIAAVKELAASAKDTVPTYVVGVGDELESLTEIAESGGTKEAFLVKTSEPALIRNALLDAINAIKLAAIPCDYEIPPPPAGEQLDRDRVNVVHSSGHAKGALFYNPSCNGGSGWRYDDANAPTRIVLCESSCKDFKATSGAMEVVFGCTTHVAPLK